MGFKYRDLEQFKEILGDDSFDYVSSGRTIDSIAEKIKALPHPLNDETAAANVNQTKFFLENIEAVRTKFFPSPENRRIAKGFEMISESIRGHAAFLRALLRTTPERRSLVNSRHASGFSKKFKDGMNIFSKGVRASFDPKALSSTKLDKSTIVAYAMDKKVGLGKKYLFNKQGSVSFARKIREFNRSDAIKTLYLLVYGTRKIKGNGWRIIGDKKCPARIFCGNKPLFGKTRVFYLYPINGRHDEYENKLKEDMKTAPFSPA